MATTKNGFYYQDNYSVAADVPEDLKKLAESVDKFADNIQQEQATQNQKILNNSNNLDLVANQLGETEQGFLQYKLENNQRVTYAEQNIIDLQGREGLNKEKIETLQQEVQELEQDVKANAITEETEQAKSLKITEASGARGKIIVFGNSEQETREGYNMYDYSKDVMPSGNGLTIDFDEKTAYLIISGTPSSDYQYITKRQDITNKLENGETYTLYAENITTGVYVQITKNKDGSSEYIIPKNNTITFVADTSYKYELDIQTSTVASTGQLNNYKTRYMLYKGTESKEFQLAGASPSLDYPSAIKCLGSNKNLVTEVLNNLWYNEDTNKFITMQNTVSVIAEIPQNTNITINKKNGGNRFAVMTSYTKPQLDVDLTTIFIDNENPNRKTYTFKNTDKKWLWVGVQNGGTEEDKQKAIEEIKIEEGEIATSYSPYGQGSTEIKKINDNLYKNDYITNSNVEYSFEDKEIKITNTDKVTQQINSYGRIYLTIPNFIKNQTYKFKCTYNNSNSSASNRVRIFKNNESQYFVDKVNLNEFSFVAEDTTLKFEIYSSFNTNASNTLTIENLMIATNVAKYIEHQEENYILDIQQEMLKGDYFDLETKEEVHCNGKAILNGTEAWTKSGTASTEDFPMFYTNRGNIVSSGEVKSNALKYVKDYQTQDTYVTSIGEAINIRIATEIIGGNTVELFKTFLQNRYNEGKAIEVYYKRSTPVRIPLNAEQIEVLEKLNKLRFFKGTNNILTTEDIALLQAIYPVNLKNVNNKMQEEIDEIKELLSTTQTSAMLLDNLEQDLIKEVE